MNRRYTHFFSPNGELSDPLWESAPKRVSGRGKPRFHSGRACPQGRVAVFATKAHEIYVMDALTGEVKWSKALPTVHGRDMSVGNVFFVADKVVVQANSEEPFYIFDIDSGENFDVELPDESAEYYAGYWDVDFSTIRVGVTYNDGKEEYLYLCAKTGKWVDGESVTIADRYRFKSHCVDLHGKSLHILQKEGEPIVYQAPENTVALFVVGLCDQGVLVQYYDGSKDFLAAVNWQGKLLNAFEFPSLARVSFGDFSDVVCHCGYNGPLYRIDVLKGEILWETNAAAHGAKTGQLISSDQWIWSGEWGSRGKPLAKFDRETGAFIEFGSEEYCNSCAVLVGDVLIIPNERGVIAYTWKE